MSRNPPRAPVRPLHPSRSRGRPGDGHRAPELVAQGVRGWVENLLVSLVCLGAARASPAGYVDPGRRMGGLLTGDSNITQPENLPLPDRGGPISSSVVTKFSHYSIHYGASSCTQPLATAPGGRLVTRSRTVAGPIGPAACRMLNMDFREFDLECVSKPVSCTSGRGTNWTASRSDRPTAVRRYDARF